MTEKNPRQLQVGQKYRHFKGKEYLVMAVANNSETLEKMVVYKALYKKDADEQLWVRPLEMFLSKVDKEKYPDCQQEYRFEEIK